MGPRGWTWYERFNRHARVPTPARGTAQPATDQPKLITVTTARIGFAKESWGEAEWTARDIA